MERSRYPRHSHRLAPATLRELLKQPVPPEYLDGQQGDGLLLCDLDESSWQRFGGEVCQQLAVEVVRGVGQAARMPMPIADRRLPPIPRGMKLADLELEVRTLNCLVSAGLHERPQDLRAITIEGVLGLRGFWVKCLVDLLTSLEYVTDHPEARKSLRSKTSRVIGTPRASCRYPRHGYRVAPETLREVLTIPVPPDAIQDGPIEGLRLCDLDQTVWERFKPEDIARWRVRH